MQTHQYKAEFIGTAISPHFRTASFMDTFSQTKVLAAETLERLKKARFIWARMFKCVVDLEQAIKRAAASVTKHT